MPTRRKAPLIVDLVKGEFIGGEITQIPEKDGRRRLKVRQVGSITADEMPYPIDPDTDVYTVQTQNLGTVKFILPRSDIPGVDLENTVYRKMTKSDQKQASDWQKRYKEEKREKNKWRKRYRDLADKVEDDEPSSSSNNGVRYQCSMCEEIHTENQWQRNEWKCPHCGRSGTEQQV